MTCGHAIAWKHHGDSYEDIKPVIIHLQAFSPKSEITLGILS